LAEHHSRREFIVESAGALAALAGFPSLALSAQRPDLIIRGGTLFDGSGSPGVAGDVSIAGGRITAVGGRLSATGVREIDARGLAVAPGFIDIHSHADGSLFEDPRAESAIREGVTTIVVGQDGSSRIPTGGTGAAPRTVRALFAAIDALPSAVNVATMVGLGTIRGLVVGGAARAATAPELATMAAMVDAALADGACGASSGLEYTPGAFASTDELIALCRPLAARRLPYATHMRNEDDHVLDSINESIAVARGAGCPLQISHLKTQGPRNWSKLDAVFARIDAGRRAGMDITFDRYPYTAYSTGLSNLFPLWSREGGDAAFVRRLTDAATADSVRRETLAKVAMIGGWDNVMITGGVPDSSLRAVVGQRVGTFATSRGEDPYALARRLIEVSRGGAGMVGFAMSEENLDRILAHPLAMVCSDGGGFAIDGPARRGSPHPRGLGTFPRVLGRYVRERKALPLSDAIRKMTSAPAQRLHLRDRGRLATGMAADVVVFDAATVADRATYEAPFQYPVGINAVIVNGAVALLDGTRGDRHTGRGLTVGV
jgi:N-acyl-D-amino-acid deacylase